MKERKPLLSKNSYFSNLLIGRNHFFATLLLTSFLSFFSHVFFVYNNGSDMITLFSPDIFFAYGDDWLSILSLPLIIVTAIIVFFLSVFFLASFATFFIFNIYYIVYSFYKIKPY